MPVKFESSMGSVSICYRVRRALGLSQRAFAKKIGVSQASVSHWEIEPFVMSNMTAVMLMLLADKHDVDLN